MGLDSVFINAVEIAFTVFTSLVKEGKYIVSSDEVGWGSTDLPNEYPMESIVNGLSQEDKKNTSFANLILPTDTIVMVRGTNIKSNVGNVKNSDIFQLKLGGAWETFNIVSHDTDPAEALFLILLRKKGAV
jgi:hypothetical protein